MKIYINDNLPLIINQTILDESVAENLNLCPKNTTSIRKSE